MPTINGIKMACAPCIRGHRSTKCNHADERLMVPVRKPGRPLSSCPHSQDQPCGCGSVTAAIPRKQQCGCGSSSHADGHEGHTINHMANTITVQSNTPPSAVENGIPKTSAAPSPTMKATSSAKAQTPNRPQSVSKQESYGAEKIEGSGPEVVKVPEFDAKMYMNPPFFPPPPEQHKQDVEDRPIAWKLPDQKLNDFAGLNGSGQLDFSTIPPLTNGNLHMLNGPTTPPIDAESKYGPFGIVSPPQQFRGYTRQLVQQPNGVVIETRIHNVGPNGIANLNGHWVPHYKEEIAMPAPAIPQKAPKSHPTPTNGGKGSCCSSKRKRVAEENPAPRETSSGGSCCASKRSRSISHSASQSTPSQLTPSQSPHLTPVINHTNHMTGGFPDFIGQPGGFGYLQQPALNEMIYPTVFAYPPTYGSYQHPLQPAQWRQGVQYNTYAHMMPANPLPQTQNQAVMGDELDTLHACGCGDGCECVGCAAHPYNEATQKYVRSAWEGSMEQTSHHRHPHSSTNISEIPNYQMNHGSSAAKPNGNINNIKIQTSGAANGSQASPAAETPSDTTGDDPPLSASDFFFVNYPYASEGCGGDMVSCPCGDDCACLGCSIHNNGGDPLPESMPDDHAKLNENENERSSKPGGGSCCGGRNEDLDEGIEMNPAQQYSEICGGDESTCPCPPDGCECIGCTIHGRG